MKLGVATIFRDEAPTLSEWFHHYLSRNVDGFIMLNDRSEDNWRACVPAGATVDVIDVSTVKLRPNRQNLIYNQFLKDAALQYDRLLIVDADEFVWDENRLDLRETFSGTQWTSLPMTTFGSCGYARQPVSVVESFTRRETLRRVASPHYTKWCVIPQEIKHYDFHYPIPKDGKKPPHFPAGVRLNHYKLQSLQRWEERVIRCGSANATKAGEWRHTHEYRELLEVMSNAYEDTGLIEQNVEYGCTWKPQHYS